MAPARGIEIALKKKHLFEMWKQNASKTTDARILIHFLDDFNKPHTIL